MASSDYPKLKELNSREAGQTRKESGYFIEYGEFTTTEYDQSLYFDSMPVSLYIWEQGKCSLSIRDELIKLAHELRLQVTKRVNFKNESNINIVKHQSANIAPLEGSEKHYEAQIVFNFELKFANQ